MAFDEFQRDRPEGGVAPAVDKLKFIPVDTQLPELISLYTYFNSLLEQNRIIPPANIITVPAGSGGSSDYLLIMNPLAIQKDTERGEIAVINLSQKLTEENAAESLLGAIQRATDTVYPLLDVNPAVSRRKEHALRNLVSAQKSFTYLLEKGLEGSLGDQVDMLRRIDMYLRTVGATWEMKQQIVSPTEKMEPEPLSTVMDRIMHFYYADSVAIIPNYYPPELVETRIAKHLAIYAIGELVVNAVKYGGGRVEIGFSEAGDDYIVTIGDRGDGIPPEELVDIFSTEYRGKKTREKAKGTGLGLGDMLDTVVKDRNGRVSLLSRNPHLPSNINGVSVRSGRESRFVFSPVEIDERVTQRMTDLSTLFVLQIPKSEFSSNVSPK